MSNTDISSFTTLENITPLLNDLVNSDNNNNTLPLKHISKLVNDLTELLNESNCYDVEIKIGMENNVKIFKAHSDILKARSSYFKAALSNTWIKKSEDDSIILLKKENISPKVFKVLLM